MESESCCRCCLLTTGEMKDMKKSVVQVSILILENSLHEEVAETEVYVNVNLLEALGQIGLKNDVAESSWHQICADCERELRLCLAFQQKCLKSLMILRSIKAEEEPMVEYLIDTKDEDDEDVSEEPVPSIVDVQKRRRKKTKLIPLLEIEPHDYTVSEPNSKLTIADDSHEYNCKSCPERFSK
jgi:hypothetical protein